MWFAVFGLAALLSADESGVLQKVATKTGVGEVDDSLNDAVQNVLDDIGIDRGVMAKGLLSQNLTDEKDFVMIMDPSNKITLKNSTKDETYDANHPTTMESIVKPIVLVHKHLDVEPDKDTSDQGALAKEAEKIKQDKQVEGEAILSGRTDAAGNMMLLMKAQEEYMHIEDLTSAKKERLMSGEFLLISFLVLISWTITQVAVVYKIYAIQMPLVCTLVGLFVGIVLNVTKVSNFLDYLEFSDDIFFMMLLPPIIFESGFNLEVAETYRNATPILYFAFLSTFLSFIFSSAGFGILFSLLPFSSDIKISMSGILSYGALISATDPVSVIALFKEVAVAPSLKAIVTGESLMNDAISISLYRTFSRTDHSGIFEPFISFIAMFFGSVFVGTMLGWVTALLFKYCKLLTAEMKISSMILFSYIAYLLSEFVGCSGIVSILFCGISQAMYTLPNVEIMTANSFRIMIGTLSHLAESVAFIYLGMASCFVTVAIGDACAAIVVTIIVVSLSRFLAIQLTATCLRALHEIIIPSNAISALTLCGLRGAVAFGLAKHARHDYGHGLGSLILAGTLAYSLFTVIMVGPVIPSALEHLGFSTPKEVMNKDGTRSQSGTPVPSRYTPALSEMASPGVAANGVENRVVAILKFIDSKLTRFLLSNDALQSQINSASPQTSPSSQRRNIDEIEIPRELNTQTLYF